MSRSTRSRLACLTERLVSAVSSSAIVRCQQPIRLGKRSEPEPDFALVRPDPAYYAHGHPGTDDVLQLIEIAHTSFRYDGDVKIPLYARHGIGEVWLIEIEAERVHVFRAPRSGSYTDASNASWPDVLTPSRCRSRP